MKTLNINRHLVLSLMLLLLFIAAGSANQAKAACADSALESIASALNSASGRSIESIGKPIDRHAGKAAHVTVYTNYGDLPTYQAPAPANSGLECLCETDDGTYVDLVWGYDPGELCIEKAIAIWGSPVSVHTYGCRQIED